MRYKIEIFLDSESDESEITRWMRTVLIHDAASPVDGGPAQVSVRPVEAQPQRLEDVAPELVRPATGDESYRVQIPGLPEGTTVPVYDATASSQKLAEAISQARVRRAQKSSAGDGWNGPFLTVEDEAQSYTNIVPSNN